MVAGSAIVPASSHTSYKRNTQLADISISCAWTTLSRMTPVLISNHKEALCGSLTNSRATIEPCPYHLPLGVANVPPLTSAGGDVRLAPRLLCMGLSPGQRSPCTEVSGTRFESACDSSTEVPWLGPRPLVVAGCGIVPSSSDTSYNETHNWLTILYGVREILLVK